MKEKFINFLKETELYNEEVLEYIKPNTVKVDYSPEAIDFIGCFPVTDENNKLRAIRMCVPKMIDDIMKYENSNITFIIGGSIGVSKEVYDLADYKLCFSDMTFPHKLMRVILLEQVYRAFKILKNETYHK